MVLGSFPITLHIAEVQTSEGQEGTNPAVTLLVLSEPPMAPFSSF